MMSQSSYPLLDRITVPADYRHFTSAELGQLADELRAKTIEFVSQTGGHLGAGLGVIELTVALHYVFNTPHDALIWDIGHQAYPHKILTGRKEQMISLRKADGLSGFLSRAESKFDVFGAGHSSTSISAAVGIAAACRLQGQHKDVIAVIGDGAMSAGMAYEAMNNAASVGKRLIVILNDNEMSIAPPVGAMSNYLSRMISSEPYLSLRHVAKSIVSQLPKPLEHMVKQAGKSAMQMATGNNFFEEMGFYYIGPIDGHNLQHLLPVLQNVKSDTSLTRPILLHVMTEKGRGFSSPKQCGEKYHAVSSFDLATGEEKAAAKGTPSYTKVFAQALIAEATIDHRVVAITAAMPSGTGLDSFAQKFPERTFDVGIAEQHAVTFAAGLACEGMKPFVALYSTFLQRAYDQVIHDVALQKLPVRFALDRAGYVGADGATHAGAFDLAFLGTLPHMVLMAASDEVELMHMVTTANAIDDGPSAFRYPRGPGVGLTLPECGTVLSIGKGRIVKAAKATPHIALLTLGPRLHDALNVAEILENEDIGVTVADARFAKPIDFDLIDQLAKHHPILLTIEEGSIGGFATQVSQYLLQSGWLDSGHLRYRPLFYPDRFLAHDTQAAQHALAGVDTQGILRNIRALLLPSVTKTPIVTAVKRTA